MGADAEPVAVHDANRQGDGKGVPMAVVRWMFHRRHVEPKRVPSAPEATGARRNLAEREVYVACDDQNVDINNLVGRPAAGGLQCIRTGLLSGASLRVAPYVH